MLPIFSLWPQNNDVVQDDGEYHALREGRTSKKGRHIKPSFVLLLIWCIAVTTFVVRHGLPSLPNYDTSIGNVFLVHFFVGWENSNQRSDYFGHRDNGVSQQNAGAINPAAFSDLVNILSSTEKTSRQKLLPLDTLVTLKNITFKGLYSHKPRHYRKIKSSSSKIRNNRDKTEDPSVFLLSRGIITDKARGSQTNDYFHCDRTHWRTDVCHLRGDVRVQKKLITFVSNSRQKTRVNKIEKIKPYPRKWESALMDKIDEVTVNRVYKSNYPLITDTEEICDAKYSVPAIVFSTGGYTGHIYHELSDGLIPLFITIQHLKGEVIFLILEFHHWWMNKYSKMIEQLSHYPIIDVRNDNRTLCFSEVIIGLKIHDELTVNSTLMPFGESIQNFRKILDQIYSDNIEMPVSEPRDKSITQNVDRSLMHNKVPILVLIARVETRALLNQHEVVSLAEQLGFKVKVLVPDGETDLRLIYRVLDTCDVMMGVHGAAMTHFLFMQPGSVFIQVVPLGTDWPASSFYGQPALRFGLHYLEYKIKPEESSLIEKYNKSDPVLTNPEVIVSKGWEALKETYLKGQNVTISIPRLKKVLLKALAIIKGIY